MCTISNQNKDKQNIADKISDLVTEITFFADEISLLILCPTITYSFLWFKKKIIYPNKSLKYSRLLK